MTNEKCPLCEKQVEVSAEREYQLLDTYVFHEPCGEFCMFRGDGEILSDATRRETWQPERIIALLCERRLRNAGAVNPLLLLQMSTRREIPGTERLRVSELLAQWPQTVPERIDRCLCNLAQKYTDPGEQFKLPSDKHTVTLLFCESVDQVEYYVNALDKNGWIGNRQGRLDHPEREITPEGWARIHALAGGAERQRNPAFVAMWFGKPREEGDEDRREEMENLFKNGIEPAIEDAGYHGVRVDMVEHNDLIMGRVIDDIRKAPFVVAELTENNPGVYYEAGFARGQKIEVIYCRKDDQRPHFDVSGINQVVYKDARDLRERLKNRILGTMGPGPHKKKERV